MHSSILVHIHLHVFLLTPGNNQVLLQSSPLPMTRIPPLLSESSSQPFKFWNCPPVLTVPSSVFGEWVQKLSWPLPPPSLSHSDTDEVESRPTVTTSSPPRPFLNPGQSYSFCSHESQPITFMLCQVHWKFCFVCLFSSCWAFNILWVNQKNA